MHNVEEEVGSSVIIPKARRPIHNTMVSYGIKKKNRVDSTPHNNEGTRGEDQVDNVMSKMARQSSPLPVRKRQSKRADQSDQLYTDEDDNTDDSDPEEEDISNAFTISQGEDSSNVTSESHHSSKFSNFNFEPNHHMKSNESSGNRFILIMCIGIGIAAAVYYFYIDSKTGIVHKTTQTDNSGDVLFENNIDKLKHKYNVDDDSILKIKTGISTIFTRMDAGSFVFVYNSKTDSFDPGRFDKFINEVANTAAKYLRNSITPIQHTVVLSSSLDMREHGELISRYRDEVSRSGVLLVKEVGALPSELAMAFHYYCDEYDPLVKRSAVLFTLNAANCSNTEDEKTTHEFVEKCLARKWKTVPLENMRPLLTRIVDIIIDVTRVF